MLGCPDVWVSLSWKQCWCGKHFRETVMDFLLCGYEPMLPLKTHPPLSLGISCTVVYSNGWCGRYTVESICPISIREGSRCVNIDTRYVYRLLNGLLSDCWLDRVDLMKKDNHVPSAHWVRINDDAHFVCLFHLVSVLCECPSLCMPTCISSSFCVWREVEEEKEKGWETGPSSLERRDWPTIISMYHVMIYYDIL